MIQQFTPAHVLGVASSLLLSTALSIASPSAGFLRAHLPTPLAVKPVAASHPLNAPSSCDNGVSATVDAASLVLSIRDIYTGRGINAASLAEITSTSESPATSSRCNGGRAHTLLFRGSRGRHRLAISAPGYHPVVIAPLMQDELGSSTVWLSPVELPAFLQQAWVDARVAPGAALLHGVIVDADSTAPVAGATIRLVESGLHTRSNADGYFAIDIAPVAASAGFAERLRIDAAGYVSTVREGVRVVGTDLFLPANLRAGTGEEFIPAAPHRLLDGPSVESHDMEGAHPWLRPEANVPASELLTWHPPSSINVTGYGWLSLEDYVGNGLNDEWIASWPAHSLRAGAIAYRGYGAWWQVTSGSICSTTSCQVYDADTSAATIAAAQHTAGILLQRAGSLAKAEYSAENNNFTSTTCTASSFTCSAGSPLPCSSGFAGGASWSCLSDGHSFAAGPGVCCFGHGRGMCQWGTRAWSASGALWPWMVNHYYNGSGTGTGLRTAYMTTPVATTSISGPSGSIPPGGSFGVVASLQNLAALPHTRILLRMQLHSPATGYIPSSASPTSVTVPATSSTAVSSTVVVPLGTPAGVYSVVSELWFDVDESSSWSAGTDLLLQQFNGPSISVSAGSAATLRVLTPNGGEVWAAGSVRTITWTASGLTPTGQVQLFWSANNGSSWSHVTSLSPAVTSYAWVVPQATTNAAKVFVGNAVGGAWEVSDSSDQPFTIGASAPPQVRVISPNGGESWLVGSQKQIAWTSANLDPNALLCAYSILNNVWAQVGCQGVNGTTQWWTVPNSPTNVARIWVGAWVNGAWQTWDESDSNFSIVTSTVPTIRLLSPNGGENWAAGTTQMIAWTLSNISSGAFVCPYSILFGAWTQLTCQPTTAAGSAWLVPDSPTNAARVWVGVWMNGGWQAVDESDQVFSISSTGPSLRVLAPNGGELWPSLSLRLISWSSGNLDPGSSVCVYSIINGSWSQLTCQAASATSWLWTVPVTATSDARIWIGAWSNGAWQVMDQSDGSFSIVP